MMTVIEAINLSTDYLAKKNIESPRINAEHLLAHILKCKRLNLYLSFDRPLKEDEVNQYRVLLLRRSKAEPLQYIIGNVEFYGLEFDVNPAVLIPRPETELLVEKIIERIKGETNLRILDVGTGSGNIAIALAKNLVDCNIIGIDISSDALKIAQLNADKNEVANKILFKEIDILNVDYFENESFNLIVSNPPYISVNDYQQLRPELAVYEPRIALTDNGDGLKFYRGISEKAQALLTGNGKLYFEIGMGQSGAIARIMEENLFKDIRIDKDYSNIDRIISGVKK